MNSQFAVQPATTTDNQAIRQLLLDNQLPADDCSNPGIRFWIVKSGNTIAGVIGLEAFSGYALLRSMATNVAFRNQGIASLLVEKLEHYCREQSLREIYLLTETAENFFARKGYKKIPREEVPVPLNESSEISHLCPSTATVMKKKTAIPKKILFVCVENSNRSQMSQAFATLLSGGEVQAFSAGSKPSGIINPKAIAAMKELGYDLSVHASKSLQEVAAYAPFDAVVTMGCGDACPWMPAKQFIDWQIPDPRNMNETDFRAVRDLIKEKVTALLQQL